MHTIADEHFLCNFYIIKIDYNKAHFIKFVIFNRNDVSKYTQKAKSVKH